jgi:uncharacterized SAM-binding protein YcdF (DUF218 family)
LTDYFIIFGAAVLPDGRPSGFLLRRVQGALDAARCIPDRIFIATGGVGRHGPSEASIIRDLLVKGGVEPNEILIEDRACDTLQSALFCDEILRRQRNVAQIVPCSSNFHIPRCALLLRILGYRSRIIDMPADRPHVAITRWSAYMLKELIATPYDAAMLLLRLLRRRFG